MSFSAASDQPVSRVVRDLRASLLEKDCELADVVLKSVKDKSRTPAVRAILAACSPVFRKMLFGGFAEANKGTLCLSDVRGCTIECIVEYCYTDEVELLRRGENMKDVVHLAVAADFYGLPELAERCFQTLRTVTIASPAQACIALEVSNGLASAEAIVDHCCCVIRHHACNALLGLVEGHAGVTFLSRTTLEQLLSDKLILAPEITLFQAALLWLRNQGPSLGKRFHAGDATSTQVENAKILSCLIDLNAIPLLQLRDLVEPSGLFTTEQLCATYRRRAIATAVCNDDSFFRPRCGIPAWESSGNESDKGLFSGGRQRHGVELLNIHLVWGFTYTWVLQVVKDCIALSVGVASGEIDKSVWLGEQAGGWVFDKYGSAFHAHRWNPRDFKGECPCDACKSKPQGIKFGTGSSLTICLDLSDRSAGGVFSINDKQASSGMFTGMRAGADDATFQPAVSLRRPGSVRIVEFLVKEPICWRSALDQ